MSSWEILSSHTSGDVIRSPPLRDIAPRQRIDCDRFYNWLLGGSDIFNKHLPGVRIMPMQMDQKKVVEPEEHHKQLNLCTTRPPYRQGRKLTAVKVYTINDESQHLLIFGVPKVNLVEDLKRNCFKYGLVKSVKAVTNYPNLEEFTEVYHVHYQKLSSARFAKKKLDEKSFYGGVLHVCYAPELESAEETRAKLIQRRKEVNFKLKRLKYSGDG